MSASRDYWTLGFLLDFEQEVECQCEGLHPAAVAYINEKLSEMKAILQADYEDLTEYARLMKQINWKIKVEQDWNIEREEKLNDITRIFQHTKLD